MNNAGWRTLMIRSEAALSCSDGSLCIQGESCRTVPLVQLKTLVLMSHRITVSADAVIALCRHNVRMIFCDEKYVPACEVFGYNNHVQTAGRIHEQAAWQHEAKERVWSMIAAQKIRMQEQVMFQCVPDQAVSLQSYVESMSCGDASNCEAQAAKVYFHRMFGRTFVRSQETTVNAALNYGYAVLRSEISRILAAHGYHSALGIHHCSRVNPYNLSCDLMEPFRPVVDALVFRCRGMDFDFEMKKQLIALPYQRIGYGDEIYSLSDAADIFCLDCFRCLKDSAAGIKELRIVEP